MEEEVSYKEWGNYRCTGGKPPKFTVREKWKKKQVARNGGITGVQGGNHPKFAVREN